MRQYLPPTSELRSARKLERLNLAAGRKRALLNTIARRERAEVDKERLAKYLELVWSNLELELPDWENSLETQPEQEEELVDRQKRRK